MTIHWQSNVQRTVTKSTTEAQLPALSAAGSEMQFWMRFFRYIHFKLNCQSTHWCDNQQTV
ncbi:hypothetical protein EJ04DRAFT_412916, partial [Polyplosphaeria fusca]